MKIPARYIVAAVLVLFAWWDASIGVLVPPAVGPAPSPAVRALATAVDASKMLPHDRQYMSAFYEALCYVLERDGERDKPLIGTTDQFARFHAGSLQLSIDKKAVGKYAGLAESVDEVFVLAAGADVQTVTDEVREKIADACRALAWKFAVHGNE